MYKVLFFKIVCIVERDILPCRSLLRVRRVDVWRLLIGTNVSVFFSPVSTVGKGRGPLLAVKLHWHPWIGDSHLMTPERSYKGKSVPRVFLECF